MNDWRVILQLHEDSASRKSCTRYATSGVARPAHITVVACDGIAAPHARAVHARIDAILSSRSGRGSSCSGPGSLGCMAWQEPACQHVLILLIGSAPLDSAYEQLGRQWSTQAQGRSVVVPALVPPLSHVQVFGPGRHPSLSRHTASGWNGSTTYLAETAVQAALMDERPGVFLSYRRSEASAAAESLHDALTHAGVRVFLDRFSGRPGQFFPHELAAEMASMGLVVLLETAGLRASRWTLWEAAFAARYRLGPVAVNFRSSGASAPCFAHVSARTWVAQLPSKALPSVTVDAIVAFIRQQVIQVALSRRTYFETLVRLAARRRGGDAVDMGDGLLSLEQPAGRPRACVLPAAVPGQLRHIARLVQTGGAVPRVLAGEHQHLPRAALDDLRWLASTNDVRLVGAGSVHRAVRAFL